MARARILGHTRGREDRVHSLTLQVRCLLVRLWDRPYRRSTVAVTLVLALSLALRLAFLAGRHAPPFSDMVGYEQRALLLLREHTFQAGGAFGATYHGPGYLVFLAAVFGLAGTRPRAVYLVQSLLSVATLWGIYLLGVRLFTRRVGLIALVLAAAYVPFFAYANLLLPETLFVCLVVFCVYAVVRGVQDGSPWWLLAGGALCGGAALTRSVALLLPVAFLVWLVLAPGRPLASGRVRMGLVRLCRRDGVGADPLGRSQLRRPAPVHPRRHHRRTEPADRQPRRCRRHLRRAGGLVESRRAGRPGAGQARGGARRGVPGPGARRGSAPTPSPSCC